MNLEHSFTVPVGIDEAWKILLDIELIGPCMPGAAIDSVDGDDFTGTVKVKLGPIGLTYKGKASFVEKDQTAHRAVIDARGRDARGNGTASAKVTATLSESGGNTTVTVDTDLDITGKPAQFGRGVMVDVGNKLIGQFADNLSRTISADHSSAAEPAQGVAETAAEAAESVTATGSTAAGAPATTKPAAKEATKAAAKAPRKRTPRPKPAVEPTVAPAIDSEVASEDLAGAEGSTGGPIEQAALAAVQDGPGSFGSPGASTDGASVNGSAAANGSSPAAAATPTAEVGAPATDAASTPTSRRIVAPRDVEPINLIESAGPAVAKRLAPVAAVVLVLVALILRRRRRRHR